MRIPISQLRGALDVPDSADPVQIREALLSQGVPVSAVVDLRDHIKGPLVVGRVLAIEELDGFKKPIRFSQVDAGAAEPNGIVCGARNFAEGDLVVVALPGAVLGEDFHIGERKTYGRVSQGMMCSPRELGLSDDHSTILVLPPGTVAQPGDDARPVTGLDEIVIEVDDTYTLPTARAADVANG